MPRPRPEQPRAQATVPEASLFWISPPATGQRPLEAAAMPLPATSGQEAARIAVASPRTENNTRRVPVTLPAAPARPATHAVRDTTAAREPTPASAVARVAIASTRSTRTSTMMGLALVTPLSRRGVTGHLVTDCRRGRRWEWGVGGAVGKAGGARCGR